MREMYCPKKDYEYDRVLYGEGVKIKGKFIYIIAKILRMIADIIMGIRSGYPMCCIITYSFNKERYIVEGIKRSLCKKCYVLLKR